MFARLSMVVFSFGIFLPGLSLAQKEQRTLLPKQINSPFAEIRPLISGDGNTLYFGRRQHPDNVRGERDLQDVYVVHREGNQWGQPKNLGSPVNNNHTNSIFTVSPDGEEYLIVNTYREMQGPFVYFPRYGEAWGEPEEVEIDGYYNATKYVDFYQSYRENVLFMAVERDDSFGEQDIFISFRTDDGNWSRPQNLGTTINTPESDFAPFLASDGQTLFFCSYGHEGRGGADIYYSFRLDDTWMNWTEPVAMESHINSSGEETYCSITEDMKTIYFVSYTAGTDKSDIYSAPIFPDVRLLAPQIAVKIPEALAGNVQVKKIPTETLLASATPASATPVQEEAASERVAEPTATASAATESEVPVHSSGIRTALSLREVKSDVAGKGEYKILRNIYFDFNQAVLKPGTYERYLQQVYEVMTQNPMAVIKVVGHADEIGNPKGNLGLSRRRAESVKNFLVRKGVAAERLLVVAMGEEEPLASNDDEREGRELNRRVDFRIQVPKE